ncbi:hypothetical protein C8J30_101640 [Rhodobacter viridis]|uniref:Uncharacterized protein n=1 Tax=Rhodobacter viridis TaxID=1054202 RepID=A0A318UBC8_9RHOB|nr:hypothetical protein [Rhodobacter viridis]PYF13251.1 hypothetical protein C8J30_101640 [Rhodobacter viridis]
MEFRIAALILLGLTLGILNARHELPAPLARVMPDFGRNTPVQISDGLEVSRSVFDPVALPSILSIGHGHAAKFLSVN